MANDSAPMLYENRELSWLKFNQRVLEEAWDDHVPLFERLRFVSIFCSNLDEFYMIRVGSLFDQMIIDKDQRDSKSNMTPKEQLSAIYAATRELLPKRDAAYVSICQELSALSVRQLTMDTLSQAERDYLEQYFRAEIMPLLSPLIVDKQHPFPFLSNKRLYIVAHLRPKAAADKPGTKPSDFQLGIVPVSDYFERLIFVPSEEGVKFIPVEDVIVHYADILFTKKNALLDRAVMRVTRNADINADEALYDQDLDYRSAMHELLKKRKKLMPVRLEVHGALRDETLSYLCDKLKLSHNQIFPLNAPLDFSFLSLLEKRLPSAAYPSIYFPSLTPQSPGGVAKALPMVRQVERGDILLSYPFESIQPFIRLLEEAADDPHVVSIKITLYRVASESKIINALIKAAENGKEVLAAVELRARFDEENNIGWSKRLEEAGCNVIYGLGEYKVHSKLCLIMRRLRGNVQYITQIGTGNYNEKTSKLYTDLSLITANPEIGADASVVFNNLAMGSKVEYAKHLLVAPLCLKSRIIGMIDAEIACARQGQEARILLKFNSMSDRVLIDKLVEASQAGVQVDLVIRGICCLRAGIPGYTDNIRIRSIVGRFLEHSRIYVFGTGTRQKVYISSADFMTRNTERRVEVAAPVYDSKLQARLLQMLDVLLHDNVKARVQQPDGNYVHLYPQEEESIDSQLAFYSQAYAAASRVTPKVVPKKQERPSPLRPLKKRGRQ